jgi:hypothetical protein
VREVDFEQFSAQPLQPLFVGLGEWTDPVHAKPTF